MVKLSLTPKNLFSSKEFKVTIKLYDSYDKCIMSNDTENLINEGNLMKYFKFFCCLILLATGGNIPQSTNYTATCLPSRKLSKLDEPGTQDAAGGAGTS